MAVIGLFVLMPKTDGYNNVSALKYEAHTLALVNNNVLLLNAGYFNSDFESQQSAHINNVTTMYDSFLRLQ